MTELEKELTIKVKRLEDDCKAYNFTQHTLQEKIKELEEKLANADYQLVTSTSSEILPKQWSIKYYDPKTIEVEK